MKLYVLIHGRSCVLIRTRIAIQQTPSFKGCTNKNWEGIV